MAVDPALFAPQVRLVDLASGRIVGTNVRQTGSAVHQETTTIVSADLISARVTLLASGISLLSVTLNNQRFPTDGMQAFPPWKYNDFSARQGSTQDSGGTFALTFGQRLRLDLRYSNATWTKMIVARITDLQFTFPSSGGAQLTITAEDMLSALKIKPSADIPYNNQQEEQIASSTVSAAGLTIPVRSEGIEERSQALRSARHQKSQTYYQFLSDISDRLDCELYVDFVDREAEEDQEGSVGGPIDVASELQIVMEPQRSTQEPDTAVTDWRTVSLGEGEYLDLRWGKSLVDFKPKMKVWEMPTSASVAGTQPNRRGRSASELTAAQVREAIKEELPRSPLYDADLIDAVTAREQFFGAASDADTNSETSHGSGLDAPRMRLKALAQVLKKVRQFMTVDANTIGVPMLRPGTYVHIAGLRPPFDGFYYVTQTVHTFDTNGYRTQLSLRRPGMLPPELYLEDSAEASGGVA